MRGEDRPLNVGLRRTSRALLIAWFFLGFPLGLLAAVHPLFVISPLALLAVVGIWSMRLRCARCGHPIHKHYVVLAGATFSYWAPWIRKRCLRCHAEIPGGIAPSWGLRWQRLWCVATAGPEPQRARSSGAVLRKRTFVLIVLIFTNIIGGVGLALVVDARLIWIAMALPTLFAVLLVALRWSSTR